MKYNYIHILFEPWKIRASIEGINQAGNSELRERQPRAIPSEREGVHAIDFKAF